MIFEQFYLKFAMGGGELLDADGATADWAAYPPMQTVPVLIGRG